MQGDFLLSSSKYDGRPVEVRVPSLSGINISGANDMGDMSLANGWIQSHRPLRPTLQRINTDVAAQSRHAPSRSLESPADIYRPGPVPSSYLNTPSSSSPTDMRGGHYIISRRSHPHLSGPFISLAGRSSLSAATSATSASSSLFAPSPMTASPSPPCFDRDVYDDSFAMDEEREMEDAWNLVPYHIPWGSSYHGYKGGTLPGPDGNCIFLRSPTPLKNQRTGQACEKCRERKAKCSGARPSCARCVARNHVCEYGPEQKRTRAEDDMAAKEDAGSDVYASGSHSPVDDASPMSAVSAINVPQMRDRRNTHSGSDPSALSRTPMARRHTVITAPTSSAIPQKRRIQRADSFESFEADPAYDVTYASSELPGFTDTDAESSLSSTTSEVDSQYSFNSYADAPSVEPYALAEPANPSFDMLSHFRFPHHNDDAIRSLQSQPAESDDHSSVASMDLDFNFNQPTAFSHSHSTAGRLHAPNPLRYSVSMPLLSHAYRGIPPAAESNTLMTFSENVTDSYATSSASSADGTDLDYEFSASPAVIHPPSAWGNGVAGQSKLHPRDFGMHAAPSSGLAQPAPSFAYDSSGNPDPAFQSYHSHHEDDGRDSSALSLFESLDIHQASQSYRATSTPVWPSAEHHPAIDENSSPTYPGCYVPSHQMQFTCKQEE